MKKQNLDKLEVKSFVTGLSANQKAQLGGTAVASGMTLCSPCTRDNPYWTFYHECPDLQQSRANCLTETGTLGVVKG